MKKGYVVPIRFSAADHRLLSEAAERSGLPVSTFIRQGALQWAASIADLMRSSQIERRLRKNIADDTRNKVGQNDGA